MTTREAPAGEPPNTTTLAGTVDAVWMHRLKDAQAQEQERAHELMAQQGYEEEQALRVSEAFAEKRLMNAATVTEFASQNLSGRPVTPEQYRALGQQLARESELARELDRRRGRLLHLRQSLDQARSNVARRERELEAAIEEAMARAREHERLLAARARARARSPRLRTIAFARSLWRLMQARQGVWDGIVRNLYLGMRVIALAAWMLPKVDRVRWKQESYGDLEMLKQEGAPLLGTAVRIAQRIPWLALVLRTCATGRRLARLEPLWIGLGTAAAMFWAGVAGIGQSPTVWQMRSLVAASLLAGAIAARQVCRGRRPRGRSRKRR